jgi:hypothetical protein
VRPRARAVRARRLFGVTLALGTAVAASAHVGTTNAYFEGFAGPYPVRVIVRTPGVIPGLAEISVRITGGPRPSRITVRPLRSDAGLEGAPPADTAKAVPGDDGLYSAELWLMTRGSYSVRVSVEGAEGGGVALVPVNAVAARRLEMRSAMAAALLAAGAFLFVGAITIFGAAVRESVLEPGVDPSPKGRRRATWAMGISGTLLAIVLFGGWTWWGSVDRAYRAGIFRPLATSASVAPDGLLTLHIDDPSWLGLGWSPLIPDHGKLMHMFLVRDDGFTAFAHVHPVPADSSSFAVPLPPLPAGRYRVYGDIVHATGYSETLVDTVTLGAPSDRAAGGTARPDPDDSWAELPRYGAASGDVFSLPSGRRVTWVGGRNPRVDQEVELRFQVSEVDGAPSALEPYMGMLSHAAVTTVDGSVFIHLHPAGSFNMAAQQLFEVNDPSSKLRSGSAAMGVSPMPNGGGVLAFPFVFPAAGSYRIFVQFKVADAVETAAFDTRVGP